MSMAQPVFTARHIGNGLSVAVWENTNEEGRVSYSAKFEKRYKDKTTGEWKDSPYLFESDLLEASELFRLAWHKIGQRKAASSKQGSQTPTGEKTPF
jgi:hypothetical protein